MPAEMAQSEYESICHQSRVTSHAVIARAATDSRAVRLGIIRPRKSSALTPPGLPDKVLHCIFSALPLSPRAICTSRIPNPGVQL
jgi:hypothetical protein